ncbi:MAG: PQQ-dependent sugar dehydrogenase [Myxococcales bacterium]|nr:PQQ-dependent sugar dehydrogenase [Myxococcales bacterium]
MHIALVWRSAALLVLVAGCAGDGGPGERDPGGEGGDTGARAGAGGNAASGGRDGEGGRDSVGGSDGVFAGASETEVVEGDGQSATVDTAVAVRPRIVVRNTAGQPVAGIAFTWAVTEGMGQITNADSVTGSDGTAAVGSWTLGPSPGTNRLEARFQGLPPVVFTATGVADSRGSLVVHEGNDQTVSVATAVPVRPAVRLQGGNGAPRVGTSVTFRVTSGGGTVSGPSATTDVSGVARVGGWTLGNTPGDNTLVAEVEGLPPVSFRAVGVALGAPVLPEPEVVVEGLDNPWDIGFAPRGPGQNPVMLFTERPGRLNALIDGSRVTVADPPQVNEQGQSGMLGLAVDPQFSSHRFVYVYVAWNTNGTIDNRVVRWRVSEDFRSVSDQRFLVTGIPYAGGGHSGGQLAFGPDGYLYVSTGDNRNGALPQDWNSFGGKVLRITRDGAATPGGFGRESKLYAYGFRNINGLAFHPASGQPYTCEHGPGSPTNDEVTPLVQGGNGGWNPGPGNDGYGGTPMTNMSLPNVMSPAFGLPSEGMSGCAFVTGGAWGAWSGRLFVGSLAGRRIVTVALDAAGTETLASDRALDAERYRRRVRAVVQGPDGAVYVTTDDNAPQGRIWRVRPR